MSAYVGLDVHKDFTFATVLDQSRVVVQRKLPNELVSFLESFNVERFGGFNPRSPLIPYFSEGFRVEVSHPKKTRYIAEARIKSDKVDSRAIAELVRLDALPKSYMPHLRLQFYVRRLGVGLSLCVRGPSL